MPRVTRIRDVAGTGIYLVTGEQRALVIDAGVGVGSLKEAVAALTDLPADVLLSHAHLDHAAGPCGFERVYMDPRDLGVYERFSSLERRKHYAARETAGKPGIPPIADSDYLPNVPAEALLDTHPGDVFDLGGVTAQVLDCAGHTPGSLAVLLPELRLLFLGDACSDFTLLFDEDCSTVAEYRDTLLRLKAATDGKYDRVLASHGRGDGDPALIDTLLAVCGDVLAGRSDAVPFAGYNTTNAVVAKALRPGHLGRADGVHGNLVYDPGRVR